MANGHIQPGQSLEFENDTGADIKSGELVPFGSGVAAKALHSIPAGQIGVVTLHDVHRVPVPDGMTLERGQVVRVKDGSLSENGDILGRFVGLDRGGWAKVLILPLTEGGGEAPGIPTLQAVVDAEHGTSRVEKTRESGGRTTYTSIRLASGNGFFLEQNSQSTSDPRDTTSTATRLTPFSVQLQNNAVGEVSLGPGSIVMYAFVGQRLTKGFEVRFQRDGTRTVLIHDELKPPFRAALGIEDDVNLDALTDEEINALIP